MGMENVLQTCLAIPKRKKEREKKKEVRIVQRDSDKRATRLWRTRMTLMFTTRDSWP